LAVASTLVLAQAVGAHAVVYPAEAPTGAYQKYVLRVPNERGFPTSEVSLVFPDGVRVISFDDVPGWVLETTSPDDGATFTGATWRGAVPVGRFVEFSFIGVNPTEATTLKWDVVQTYSDGTVVAWAGPPDSSTPASITSVQVPVQAGSADADTPRTGILLGGVALLLALISLGLALRPAQSG
jgi:uncharacterized protein YcnI